MRVLVLDGNENQAVASVRSLAKTGHQIVVGSESSWSKAGWSRYAHRSFQYPSPERGAEQFVRALADEVRRWPESLILPMTERTTLPLSAHRELIFHANGKLILPEHAYVKRCFDKRQTTALAKSLGIATPKTEVVRDGVHAREIASILAYPVVLKAQSSQELSGSGHSRATGRPLYARNANQFLDAYADISSRTGSVLVQEFIQGYGSGYFALMRHGELRAEFAHRRIRDVYPTGSGSSVRISIAPAAQMKSAALAVLRDLRWHGVAMVEFRVQADGTPIFMEVNGRFWNSLSLAIAAGVNFPALLAELAETGDVSRSPTQYKIGVQSRWLLGDVRHLVEVWRGAPTGFPGQYPGRISSLVQFLKATPGMYHDNFLLTDPLPELGDWVDFVFRRVPRAVKRNGFGETKISARSDSHSQPLL